MFRHNRPSGGAAASAASCTRVVPAVRRPAGENHAQELWFERWIRSALMSIYNHPMILAGDVGGTKTLIGLFEFDKRRPVPIDIQSFATTDYPGLPAIIEAFYESQQHRPRVTGAAFGVAGPVINQSAQMTNVA